MCHIAFFVEFPRVPAGPQSILAVETSLSIAQRFMICYGRRLLLVEGEMAPFTGDDRLVYHQALK